MLLRPTKITRLWAPGRLLQACSALTSKDELGMRWLDQQCRSQRLMGQHMDSSCQPRQIGSEASLLTSAFLSWKFFDSQTEHYRMRSAPNTGETLSPV